MAWHQIAYSCGHQDRINLIGPHAHRERRIHSLESGPCFDCYKMQSTQAAQAKASEAELPPLVGTEAQIVWAETLRMRQIEALEQFLESHEPDASPYLSLVAARIIAEPSAKVWIDWRYLSTESVIRQVYRAMQQEPTPDQIQQQKEEQARINEIRALAIAEATMRPSGKVITESPVEIRVAGQQVLLSLPEKHEGFRTLVRDKGYQWDAALSAWKRTLSKWNGTPEDRAVEMGCLLLASGFIVCCFDATIRARIQSSDYQPECTRWIRQYTAQDAYHGWLVIVYERGADLYDAARRIPGSRYHQQQILVPPAQFEQVLDFAERYHFQLSEGAQEVIRLARATKDAMLRCDPSLPSARPIVAPPKIPALLAIPEIVEVAEELQDV